MVFEAIFKQQLTAYKGKKVLLTLTTENVPIQTMRVVEVQNDFVVFDDGAGNYPDIIPLDKIARFRLAKGND